MYKKRVKIGDIIEIPTSKGFSYAQYTHQHNRMGGLIRILMGFFKEPPHLKTLEHIVKQPHRFSTFFPTKAAISKGIFKIVGNFHIPKFAKEFPIFKNTASLPNDNIENINWWLWDGKKEWKVGLLSENDQKKYPEKIIYNDTGLVCAIETGMNGKRRLS